MILLSLLLYFTVTIITGTGVSYFLFKRMKFEEISFFFPLVGYFVINLSYLGVAVTLDNSEIAFYLTIFITFVSFFYLFKKKLLYNIYNFFTSKEFIFFTLLVLCVYGLPYIFSGFGEYFHTGNEDSFDVVRGAEFFKNDNINWASHQTIILQCSTLSLIALLLDVNYSFDAMMINGFFNLIMFGLGIYYLLKKHLDFSRIQSFFAASCCLVSNLFYTSFINGHIGSTIFCSLMPYLIFAGIEVKNSFYSKLAMDENSDLFTRLKNSLKIFIKETNSFYFLFVIVLLVLFVKFIYFPPILFYILPLGLYFLFPLLKGVFYTKEKNWLLILSLIIVILLPSAYFSQTFARLLSRVALGLEFNDTGRAWIIANQLEFVLIYWGLLMSNVTNMAFTWNQYFFNRPPLMAVFYLIACLFIFISILGLLKFRKNRSFFIFYFGFWLLGFFMIKFMWRDPYYIYKFYYINQFIIIISFMHGLFYLIGNKIKGIKIFSWGLLSLFLYYNIRHVAETSDALLKFDVNRDYSKFLGIVNAPDSLLKDACFDFTQMYYRHTVEFLAKREDIKLKDYYYLRNDAKYHLTLNHEEDLHYNAVYFDSSIVYQDSLYKLYHRPENFFYLRSRNRPEIDPRDNQVFKWSYGNFYFQGRKNQSLKEDYIRVCFESNIGYKYEPFNLTVKNDADEDIFTGKVLGNDCKFIPITNSYFAYRFLTKKKGNRFLPFDERKLNYMVRRLGFSNGENDLTALKYYNRDKDVVPKYIIDSLNNNSIVSNSILLGRGWWTKEVDSLRWGTDDMEFLVMQATKDSLLVNVDMEKGPSILDKELHFQIINQDSEVVLEEKVSNKANLSFYLPVKAGLKTQAFMINILNEPVSLVDEPKITLGKKDIIIPNFIGKLIRQELRFLNFKLLSIKTEEN